MYLDHAATTPVRPEALSAMLPYFDVLFANGSSLYAAGREARLAIDRARSEVAGAIGVQPGEVIFTSGGSEADNWAILGMARAFPEKKHIVTTRIEHHAVLRTCQALERRGFDVTYLDVDARGRVVPQDVVDALRADTLLVSVMLANNEIGTIEPVGEIARIAHMRGVPVHSDAVQAVGHVPVDVSQLGVDLLSLSAHKFSGPKGVGALYVRAGLRMDPLIFGGAQERGMRAGTENTPGIVGMGCALRLAVAEMEEAARHASRLRDVLERELAAMPGVHVNGDRENRLPGHLHLTIDDADSSLLLMRLDMAGIAASAGSACTSGAAVRSHVVKALGTARDHQADIRFSLGASNTQADIDAAVAAMHRILKR
ncbi:MAG: cysteine desulfurase family protein [Candidatus Ventricola sp.]